MNVLILILFPDNKEITGYILNSSKRFEFCATSWHNSCLINYVIQNRAL